MVKTKGITRTTSNWKQGTQGAVGRYTEGINNTTGFKQASLAGDETYKQKIQESIANDARRKGVENMDEAKWKQNAASKGAQRWAPGVAAAEGDYSKSMGKVLSVIESVQLPPRTVGARANIEARSIPLAERLERAKKDGEL